MRRELESVEVVAAERLEDAKAALRDADVDCVVTEYDLPDGTGLELVGHVRSTTPDIGCILHTTTDRRDIASESSDTVITEYVEKGTPGAGERLGRMVRTTALFSTQTAYPLPDDEAERLAALDTYDFDADALETDVGRITDLAADHFDVPQSSINVIKEHEQEFLTCHGVEWSISAREDSICTYTILDDSSVTVVEDTESDPRFEHNQHLRDLGIRSYMGATLTTADGLTIGTLCVYDEEPRSFSDADGRYLQTLADLTMRLIALHDEAELSRIDREDLAPEGDRT